MATSAELEFIFNDTTYTMTATASTNGHTVINAGCKSAIFKFPNPLPLRSTFLSICGLFTIRINKNYVIFIENDDPEITVVLKRTIALPLLTLEPAPKPDPTRFDILYSNELIRAAPFKDSSVAVFAGPLDWLTPDFITQLKCFKVSTTKDFIRVVRVSPSNSSYITWTPITSKPTIITNH